MKLLILDMDETLLHTSTEYQLEGDYDFKIIFDEGGWSEKTTYFVRKRPNLDEFLDFAFNNFKVAVWTAGGKDYATEALTKCGINLNALEFFWTRDKCTIKIDLETGNYYGLKKLDKVKKLGWSLNDVLIVDDVKETASENYGNLVQVKPYYYGYDDELLKLIKYLDKIKNESNYRRIDKRHWTGKI